MDDGGRGDDLKISSCDDWADTRLASTVQEKKCNSKQYKLTELTHFKQSRPTKHVIHIPLVYSEQNWPQQHTNLKW